MGLNRIVSGNPIEVKNFNYGTSVKYTKVGSPTITNGIASGFSASNYLQTSSDIPYNNLSWEYFLKFTTSSDVTTQQALVENAYLPTDGEYYGLTLYIQNGKITVRCGTGNNQGIVSSAVGDVLANTTYYLCAKYDGTSSYTIDFGTSADNLTRILTATSNYSIGSINYPVRFGVRNYTGYPFPFGGSIDFNETYIKINGKLWFFRPCVNYIKKEGTLVFADNRLYLAGPSNYTKVGSPTVTDCVMGNFSDSNYATAPYPTTIPTKTECIINFTTGDTITGSSNQSILNFVDFLNIEINTSGQLYTYDYTKKQRVGNVNLATNTNYYCKILFVNNQKTLSLSTDGVNYTTFADFNDAWHVSLSGIIYFGKHPANANRFFKGSIDFKKTYINIDDSLYFYGKNYATQNIAPVPAGFPYGIYAMPSVGYIDMRTQQFTAAPTGATIGRDE